MGEVIHVDFALERAYKNSGIKDRKLLRDMLDNCYDPCDPGEVKDYWAQQDLISILGKHDITFINIDNEPLTYTIEQDYIYEPDFSAFFTDNEK